jgi:concentrative nucleoside transporter, CNT family
MDILRGLFGLAVLIGIAWIFSNNKSRVDWKLVGTGVLLQIAFAAFVLLTPFGSYIFGKMGEAFVTLLSFTTAGAEMILGPKMSTPKEFGFIFIFHALPTVIFFAALMGILYHLGIMQKIVKVMAWMITKVMNVLLVKPKRRSRCGLTSAR